MKGTIMFASKSLVYGSLPVKQPTAILVTEVDSVITFAARGADGAFFLYGSVWDPKDGPRVFITRKGDVRIAPEVHVEVITHHDLIAGLAADGEDALKALTGLVTCQHIHDTSVSLMPEGVTWTFGIVRRTTRDCPVCRQGSLHGCLGAPKAAVNITRYGKHDIREDLMGQSCAAKDAVFKKEAADKKAAAAALKAAAKAPAVARVEEAAASTEAPKRTRAPRKSA